MTRVVTIMGSGETAPTMVKVHRAVLDRLGPPPVPALLLGTPFGFQENAAELAGRAVAYFRESLRAPLEVADAGPGGSGQLGGGALERERLTAALRDAAYVFAGPGSPSYALRRWKGSVVPGLLVEKLLHGGAVTFASAAALTLGARTVPVYEIYKVGEEPHWLEGLDVLGAVGLHVAVVPHYNNAEGGTHDTRFCYLGERRLAALEEQLPEGVFVLGVDEHTSCSIDLDARAVEVGGVGVVTVRRAGRSVELPSGATLPLDELVALGEKTPRGEVPAATAAGTGGAADRDGAPGHRARTGSPSPLLDLVRERESAFAEAISARDADRAVATALELERELVEWSTDVPQQDELDRARAALRTMIVGLGEAARSGLRDPREAVAPFVDALLEARESARAARDFATADSLRDRLVALGIELRDSPEGTSWMLRG